MKSREKTTWARGLQVKTNGCGQPNAINLPFGDSVYHPLYGEFRDISLLGLPHYIDYGVMP